MVIMVSCKSVKLCNQSCKLLDNPATYIGSDFMLVYRAEDKTTCILLFNTHCVHRKPGRYYNELMLFSCIKVDMVYTVQHTTRLAGHCLIALRATTRVTM